MCRLSKCCQKGGVGFARRPCASVSASSRWLNSSVTSGTGTGRTGISARRSAVMANTSATAVRAGRRVSVGDRRGQWGRQPLFQAHHPAATSATSSKLKSWRTPCHTPARLMIRISSSRILIRIDCRDANLYRFRLDASAFAALMDLLAGLPGGAALGARHAGAIVVRATIPAIALGGGFGKRQGARQQ